MHVRVLGDIAAEPTKGAVMCVHVWVVCAVLGV
jgi:hypothetical protein